MFWLQHFFKKRQIGKIHFGPFVQIWKPKETKCAFSKFFTIYRIYVQPRLMYGLEAVTLEEKHMTSLDMLEDYHRKTVRDLQSLPARTHKVDVKLEHFEHLLCDG